MDTEREHEGADIAPDSGVLLWIAEAAKRLGLSQQTVRRLFDAGELDGFKLPSGYRRITPESVDALYLRMQGKTG